MKKTNVKIEEYICPYCDHKEIIQERVEVIDEENKTLEAVEVDYWECPNCGSENDIGLESFEEDFKIFKKFTEKDDFEGLLNFCKNNDFDDFILYSLGKYYIQKKEFKKAREIGKVLVSIDNKDIVAKDDLIDTPLERLKSIKNSKK